MEESKNTVVYNGVSFVGILFIVFLVLKLTHAIDWSWWWVTSPLWGTFAFFLVFLIVFIIAIETLDIFND